MALALNQDNPYSYGRVVTLSDSTQVLDRVVPEYQSSFLDKFHILKEDDNLWAMSVKYYNSSKWYWVILDANGIDNPFDLEVGSELIIPDLEVIKASRL